MTSENLIRDHIKSQIIDAYTGLETHKRHVAPSSRFCTSLRKLTVCHYIKFMGLKEFRYYFCKGDGGDM